METKLITVAFYGAVVKDDNSVIKGFFEFVAKCKKNGHKIRVFSDIQSDYMKAFCHTNNLMIFEGDESYDYIISPLAVGCPIDGEGNVDWDLIDIILEGVLFPSTPKSNEVGEHLGGISPHVATDRLKFNVEEGEE